MDEAGSLSGAPRNGKEAAEASPVERPPRIPPGEPLEVPSRAAVCTANASERSRSITSPGIPPGGAGKAQARQPLPLKRPCQSGADDRQSPR
jgi:hypothetical protein